MTIGSDLEMSAPASEEIDALDAVLSPALHFPRGTTHDFVTVLGAENFRAVRRSGRIVAGLGIARMGQWFGGSRVPLAGLTAVGVAPDYRGGGVGSAMLRAVLEDLHAEGVPLSALYPATLPYYQRAGYERAGQRVTYELPLEAIDVRDRALDLVPAEAAPYEEFYHAYEQRARHSAGNLDRPAWMWQQRLEPKDKQPNRFLVVNNGKTEGYVVFSQGGRNDPLTVLDVCVLTRPAGRRLLALFAGYRSMVEHVVWSGGPLDPFVYLLGEQLTAGSHGKVKIVRSLDWMLRIVHVGAALGIRGYPPQVEAELHFDLRDDLLAANNRRFVLALAGGRGEVRHGGAGRIRLHVRDLAAIYSGFMAPAELCYLGTVDATDEDLALVSAVFSGPRPWIADMF